MKYSISGSSIILLAIIGAVAVSLAVLSYQFSTFTSAEIAKIASEDFRNNAKIQAHDAEGILANKLQSISTNLRLITSTPTVQDSDLERGKNVFNAAQDSTSEVSDFYMWLDQDGKMLWLSNINQTTYEQFKGTDLSYRPYFTELQNNPDNPKTYYSSLIDSNDDIPRIYISYPIVDEGVFKGAAVSGIRLESLGTFLQGEVSPGFQSSVGIVDKNGIILYTRNQTIIGTDVFGPEFQTILPPAIKDEFNDLMRRSLAGEPGVYDFTFAGNTTSIAYEPIIIEGEQFGTMYVTTRQEFTGTVNSLIEQEKNLSTILIILIAAVAFGVALLVIIWNRRLETVVVDRTAELKRSNDLLQQANESLRIHDRMQKEFINVAAHELRTPTQAILGYSELLQNESKDKDDMVRAVYRNALRLQQLASDILDVTRIESESLTLNKEEFNLKDVISSALSDAKSQVINGEVKFVYKPEDITVNADRGRIMQVISNLLDNSIKFTKEGEISVATGKVGGQVTVTVKDSGTGINPDILPRLFSKFATKSDKGTGLGLFISRSIIEAHDGKMWAANNSDRGATFGFSIPADGAEEN